MPQIKLKSRRIAFSVPVHTRAVHRSRSSRSAKQVSAIGHCGELVGHPLVSKQYKGHGLLPLEIIGHVII